ncbi:hypothetical protein [Nannocystis pusilla]|uniref:Lipoprotein n=1 Tax=Nannocystis pusilla TaxID=889268 RepID=A0ABS7TLQ4_9BACT|nr:hypothetical protein [Nannocystis pusilla]MBZ5709143.1 hypothetical protein [Nannocystis pusilla]
MLLMRRLLSLLLVLIPACGSPNQFEEGDVCVDPSLVAMFEAGDAITFEVVFEECISACARRVETACDVRVEGDVIFLDARGSYREPGPGACIALCAQLEARCEVPDLAPGTYKVRSGDHELTVTLPSAEPPDQPDSCQYFLP